MYFTPTFCLILCTLPIAKGISLKIDGLINFGDNWSYEYRVLRSGVKHSHHQKGNETGQQKDEDHLRVLENRLRQEAAKHRKEVLQKDVKHTDKRHKPEKGGRSEKAIIQTTVTTNERKASETSSSENSSSDSDSETRKKVTAMIYDETTKKTKKILRFIKNKRDYSETQSQESPNTSDSSERSASWIDKTRHAPEDDASVSSHDSNINIINHYVNPRAPTDKTKASKVKEVINKTIDSISIKKAVPTVITTTRVTTVRTEEIFTNPHNVKDDTKITEFTTHLYKQTLKVFDVVKHKTNQDHLKSQIDRLARSYEDKFKEFLRETANQKIKTRLGTQKVILNTIDMSNKILRRLMNFMVVDLDRKGVLRYNTDSANVFQKTIEMEQKMQLAHACKIFGICRSGDGFSAFLTKVLISLLNCDDRKLKQAFDALTETTKNMEFIPGIKHQQKAKDFISLVEMQEAKPLRAVVMIIKNLITRQYKPFIMHGEGEQQVRMNSTLAFLEIIDLMDTKIQRNESNALLWADIENSLGEFAAGKRHDILELMTALAKHVMKNIESFDEDSRKILSKNVDIILSSLRD